jgi:hypothetical protein
MKALTSHFHVHFSRELSSMLRETLRELNYAYDLVKKDIEIHVYVTKADVHEPALHYLSGEIHKVVLNLSRIEDLEKFLIKKAFYILRHELFRIEEHFAPQYLSKLETRDKDAVKLVNELKNLMRAPFDIIEELAGAYFKISDVKNNMLSWKENVLKSHRLDAYTAYKKWSFIYSWLIARKYRDIDLGVKLYSALLDSVHRPYNQDYQASYWYTLFRSKYQALEPEYMQILAKLEEPKVYQFAVSSPFY